jgi:hypothetical protein
LAATFNVPLVQKVVAVISTEFHATAMPHSISSLYRGLTV